MQRSNSVLQENITVLVIMLVLVLVLALLVFLDPLYICTSCS